MSRAILESPGQLVLFGLLFVAVVMAAVIIASASRSREQREACFDACQPGDVACSTICHQRFDGDDLTPVYIPVSH